MRALDEQLVAALGRGAPPRRLVIRAIVVGALAQLAGVALVGGAAGLLTWSALRPGLGAVAGLLILVELVAFARAPLRHAERVAAHDLGLDGLTGWRTWLLDGVATWSPSRLAAARAGDLLSRCLEDTDRLQDAWVRVVIPAASAIAALVVASVLLAIAVPLAGVAVAVATLFVAMTSWAGARRVVQLGSDEASLRASVAARTVEYAHGAEALGLLGADGAHVAATTGLIERADRCAAKRVSLTSQLGLLAAIASAVALVVAVGGTDVPTSNPSLAAGVALAVLACGELLAALPASLLSLGPVVGSARRLGSLADTSLAGTTLAPLGPLALTAVDVAATAEAPTLIANVTFEVDAGRSVAVTGPTGSGKSSLLAVAAHLEAPRAGVVSLGGTDVTELEESSLRRRVAWLPTHPSLLEGTVRDVLDLGRGLDDAVLNASLHRVGLDEVLAARGGLDAVLAPRADDLSGGERRRLALARLLAGDADVYVLDEPTAGLDDQTSALTLDTIRASGAAVVVATHDPRVVAWADSRRTVRDGQLD